MVRQKLREVAEENDAVLISYYLEAARDLIIPESLFKFHWVLSIYSSCLSSSFLCIRFCHLNKKRINKYNATSRKEHNLAPPLLLTMTLGGER
jgi:hypothetical protein